MKHWQRYCIQLSCQCVVYKTGYHKTEFVRMFVHTSRTGCTWGVFAFQVFRGGRWLYGRSLCIPIVTLVWIVVAFLSHWQICITTNTHKLLKSLLQQIQLGVFCSKCLSPAHLVCPLRSPPPCLSCPRPRLGFCSRRGWTRKAYWCPRWSCWMAKWWSTHLHSRLRSSWGQPGQELCPRWWWGCWGRACAAGSGMSSWWWQEEEGRRTFCWPSGSWEVLHTGVYCSDCWQRITQGTCIKGGYMHLNSAHRNVFLWYLLSTLCFKSLTKYTTPPK